MVTILFLVRIRLSRGLSSGGVILALQAADGIHLGVDHLGVVRHVGRLLDGNVGSRPAELVKDGDLILLIGRSFGLGVWTRFGLLRLRGMPTRVWFGMVGFASWIA